MTAVATDFKYCTSDEFIRVGHGCCPGCGLALAQRYFLKGVMCPVVLVRPPGCPAPGSGTGIDVVGSPFGNAAVIASGVKSGLVASGDNDTLVVPWAGDGATFDIGFGGLSAAAERNEDIIYVCYDNEAYQNTGNQRSSASPWKTINATNPLGAPKTEFKKDITGIIAAHTIPYAAAASVGFPEDLMEKARRAKSIKGFKFLHILSPCPTGWGFNAELTMEIGRMAVDTRLFPIYEVEDGVRYKINREPTGIPLSRYTKVQKRFTAFTPADMEVFEKAVEERWRRLKYLAGYQA